MDAGYWIRMWESEHGHLDGYTIEDCNHEVLKSECYPSDTLAQHNRAVVHDGSYLRSKFGF